MRLAGLDRRLPRWRDVRPLVSFRTPRPGGRAAGLAAAASIDDLRVLAYRRAPRAVFDYVDGGAGDETSLARAREAFAAVEFRPRVLRNVAAVDLSTTILGRRATMPLAFGPTGFTRMMHAAGERAVARAAAREGLPYALSTMGTTSIEDLAAAAPNGTRWFQLYVWHDRARSQDLVVRAHQAGYSALIVTVDVPVQGSRLRDTRNGLTIPPALSLRNLAGMARHPRWCFDALTTEPLNFATFDRAAPNTLSDLVATMFDATVTFDDLDWLRATWPGRLVVKGLLTLADVTEAVRHGADAVVLSNHGGRQLDRTRVPLEFLPSVVDKVGDHVEILIDGGVRNGADVVAAVALGARACLIGRAYLYGLMAGGEAGVVRATELLRLDAMRTMQLLGARTVAELDASMVCQRSGPASHPRVALSERRSSAN